MTYEIDQHHLLQKAHDEDHLSAAKNDLSYDLVDIVLKKRKYSQLDQATCQKSP
jgi:hypothetical protein